MDIIIVRDKLQEYTDLIFENENSFISSCCDIADIDTVIDVHFSSEDIKVALLLTSGDTIVTYIGGNKFYEWAELTTMR